MLSWIKGVGLLKRGSGLELMFAAEVTAGNFREKDIAERDWGCAPKGLISKNEHRM
jgi:hypothetical protein